MAIHTVGAGETFATIAAAVAASSDGDTIEVQAGLYQNDFVTIRHDLILNAVGGAARLVATVSPPNGKAIITEGGAGVDVAISGFDISGARVPDGNGAAIRYEGGTLVLNGVTIHGNEDGLLGGDDPGGSIAIAHSAFQGNGSGTGYTHGIYVNRIGQLTISDSTITGTSVGHQVKSRAASTVITGSLIADGEGGTGSYLIDLPNGGAAVIEGNTLQKGAAAQNPIAISFGEEGNLHSGSTLTVQGNTLVSDLGYGTAVRNTTGTAAVVQNNLLYGWNATADGVASLAGNVAAALRPAVSAPGQSPPVVVPPVVVPPVVVPPVVVPPVVEPPVVVPPVVVPPVVVPPVVVPPVVERPVAEVPVVVPPVVVPPVEAPPVVVPPVVERPVAEVPVVVPPVVAPPVEVPPVVVPPVVERPVAEVPVVVPPVVAPPVEVPPVVVPPVVERPVAEVPVVVPPVVVPPVETPPVAPVVDVPRVPVPRVPVPVVTAPDRGVPAVPVPVAEVPVAVPVAPPMDEVLPDLLPGLPSPPAGLPPAALPGTMPASRNAMDWMGLQDRFASARLTLGDTGQHDSLAASRGF